MAVGKRTPFSKAALCFAAFTLASRYVFTYLCLYEHSFYLADSLFFDNGIIAPDSFPFLTDASFQLKRLVGFTGFLEQKSCFAPAYGCSKGVLLLGEKYRHKSHRIPVDLYSKMCYAVVAGSPALAGEFLLMGRQVWTIIFLQI